MEIGYKITQVAFLFFFVGIASSYCDRKKLSQGSSFSIGAISGVIFTIIFQIINYVAIKLDVSPTDYERWVNTWLVMGVGMPFVFGFYCLMQVNKRGD